MAESHTNSDIEKLKERVLKITEALYRTTDILFDGEPLKWSLRTTALDIMNIVSNLNSAGQMRELDRLNAMIQNLFLKLELASSGTYISKMNFEVLKREYSALNNNIVEHSKSPVLLEIQQPPQYQTKDKVTDIVSDRHEMDTEVDTKISDRKTVIMSALKDGGPSSVSDVAKLFNGTIGEKTVQRELNSLVEVGTIKKEGEKRWRRYFL